MPQRISLLFGVHAHQPVGNFEEVLVEAHERCYGPFLRTLHRFPGFRFSVHFSGWLLDFLLERFPADMALLREMTGRGQVELFGAGDTEPVLAVIPHRDRVGQLNVFSDKLERTLGQRPEGAWLTERVWEATVVPAMADAGIRYATVDDYHFLCTGLAADSLTGYFTTEEDGRRIDVFPISEALRYRIPFSTAQATVEYIESLAARGERHAAVYFDDIEKFGIWPETYEWVYEKGWLEDFIRRVLASPRIVTSTFRDYHAAAPTRGIVYLPTTSYIEMNEWTLPAGAAHRYADLVQMARNTGRFDDDKAFLRGGIWKNFLSRYPESNWMHKRMLQLSRRLADLPSPRRTPEMTAELYRAQSNDAYWHGLFGGIYLPHLRRAVYRALVSLEAMLDAEAPRPASSRADADLDGHDELFLANRELQAVVRLDGLGAVLELDSYPLKHNFADSLSRRPEHYYRKMHLGESHSHSGEGIASAHDRVSFKHEIGPRDLEVDFRPRVLFLDRWAAAGRDPRDVADYRAAPGASAVAELSAEVAGGSVSKRIAVDGGSLSVSWRFPKQAQGAWRTELNLAMPSCDGPAGRYIVGGGVPGGFGQPLDLDAADLVVLEDDVLGGRVEIAIQPPAKVTGRPFFSVSQSEAGFEKIMQAATLTLEWPLERLAGKSAEVILTVRTR